MDNIAVVYKLLLKFDYIENLIGYVKCKTNKTFVNTIHFTDNFMVIILQK